MRGFFYIINTVDENGELTGTAPDISAGLITLGTEKPQIRAKVEAGDYIIGISRAFPGKARRVIYAMHVGEVVTFKEAWQRGQTDPVWAAHRGGTANPEGEKRAMMVEEGPIIGGDIHVRWGKNGYEHVSRAVHAFTWRKDIEGERDRYVAGDSTSRHWGANGPVITDEIAHILGGKDYTAQYPLGEGCSYRVLNSAPALRKFLDAVGFFTPVGGARRVVRVIRKAETEG